MKPPPKKKNAPNPPKKMASKAHLALHPHPRVEAFLASLLGAPIGSLPHLLPQPRVLVDVVNRSLEQSYRWCLG